MDDLARIIEAVRQAREGDATAAKEPAARDAAARLYESALAGGHDGDPFAMNAPVLSMLAEYLLIGDDSDPRRAMACVLAVYLTDPNFLTVQGRELGASLLRDHAAAVGAKVWSDDVGRMLMTARRVGSAALIDQAISKARIGRDVATPGSVERSALLGDLSAALQTRFFSSGDLADLDEAIDTARLAVAETPHDQLMWSLCRNNLGATLRVRYEVTGSSDDLDESIDVFRVVTEDLDTVSSPSHVHAVSNLGVALRQRYEMGGDSADIDESIRRSRDAVALAATYPPSLREYKSNLAAALLARPAVTFRGPTEHPDPTEAINLLREALTAPADDVMQEHVDRNRLAIALRHRFELRQQPEDADEAETIARRLMADSSTSPHARPHLLTTLSGLLLARLRHASASLPRDEAAAEQVEAEALQVARETVELTSPGHLTRVTALIILREVLRHRWERRRDRGDLDEIVGLDRDVVENGAASGWRRAVNLNHLGSDLISRHELGQDAADLDDALATYGAAAAAAPREHAEHARALALQALALQRASRHAAGVHRLDASIMKFDEALDVTPRNDSDWVRQTLLQSVNRRTRFERAGDPADLNAAIRLGRSALTADTSPELTAEILSHLGAAHRTRYEHVGDSLDLNVAITVGRAAVAVTAAGPADHAGAVSHLSLAYMQRADRSGDPLHLYLAVELCRVAVAVEPVDAAGSVRALHLSNLAIMLLQRAEQDREDAHSQDRDRLEAVTALRAALALEPAGSPDRGRYLHNLGTVLQDAPETAEEAVSLFREAVEATPAGHPALGGRRWSLGLALFRQDRTGQRHVQEALALWRDVVESRTTPTGVRLLAARSWGQVASGPESLAAYTAAVGLLPVLANRGLRRPDKETRLVEGQGLAGAAAASALTADRPDVAVALLESGRAVLWQQATGASTELNALADKHPNLAARMGELRAMLDAEERTR